MQRYRTLHHLIKTSKHVVKVPSLCALMYAMKRTLKGTNSSRHVGTWSWRRGTAAKFGGERAGHILKFARLGRVAFTSKVKQEKTRMAVPCSLEKGREGWKRSKFQSAMGLGRRVVARRQWERGPATRVNYGSK